MNGNPAALCLWSRRRVPLVRRRVVGAGSSSRIALDDQFAFVFTFKGERVIREQAFRNREEAVEAAGLPD